MKMNKSLWLGLVVLVLCIGVFSYAFRSNSDDRKDGGTAQGASSGAGDRSGSAASTTAQAEVVTSAGNQSGGAQGALAGSHGAQPAQPVSTVAGHAVEYPGRFAKATVQVDGKSYQLTPNQIGNFPRVLVQPKDTIHVQVAYPQGQPGDAVVVETEDGGNLDGKKMANITALDGQQKVQFNFQTTSQPGIYHVALRNGPDVKVLNFWAGPEPEVRQ